MAPELEGIVARDLGVVGREVARLAAFVMVAVRLPVGLDGQVTTRAAGGPREVAREAGHLVVAVGHLRRVSRTPLALPAFGARMHELGAGRFLVVFGMARRDR